jgi:hypothetical protein
MKVKLILLDRNNKTDCSVENEQKQYTFLFDEFTSLKEHLAVAKKFWSVSNVTVCIYRGETHVTESQLENILLKLIKNFSHKEALELGLNILDVDEVNKCVNVYTYELEEDKNTGDTGKRSLGTEILEDRKERTTSEVTFH